MRTPALAIAMAFLAGILCGQQGQSFDVASIKPLKIPDGPFHFNVLPERLDVKNLSLRFLIEEAFDLPHFQVSGPDSLDSHSFDIVATTGGPVSRADMRTMLRNLLIERFHLATHWNTRTEALYRLEVLPGGPAMKVAAEGRALPNSPMMGGSDSWQLTGPMSMRQLAESLTHFAGKPVLDATNLEGYFKIALTFAREDLDAQVGSGPAAPFLNNAVQEQLGLKLVPEKQPVKILIVDHIDDVPVAN